MSTPVKHSFRIEKLYILQSVNLRHCSIYNAFNATGGGGRDRLGFTAKKLSSSWPNESRRVGCRVCNAQHTCALPDASCARRSHSHPESMRRANFSLSKIKKNGEIKGMQLTLEAPPPRRREALHCSVCCLLTAGAAVGTGYSRAVTLSHVFYGDIRMQRVVNVIKSPASRNSGDVGNASHEIGEPTVPICDMEW